MLGSVQSRAVLGDRRVCVDFVCFKVELRVGPRALLLGLMDLRGMREDGAVTDGKCGSSIWLSVVLFRWPTLA